jgi:hypothetical protein
MILPPPPIIDPAAPMIARTDRIVVGLPPLALAERMLTAKLEDQIPELPACRASSGSPS